MRKFILYISLILILIISYELISIDNKYINKSAISVDINNIRNPQIKKIFRKLDLYLGSFYFTLSKKKTRGIPKSRN